MTWAVLLASLAGSLHCAAMCGGFAVVAATAGGRGRVGGQVAYSFGRLLAYATLGAMAGLVGSVFAVRPWVRDAAGVAVAFHGHHAVDQGEQSIVAAGADIRAGLEAGAPLPDDDGAGGYGVTGELLEAQPLRVAVPPVAGAADAFLMSHFLNLVILGA